MQHARNASHTTHPALHLRDAADAQVVFEAVRLGTLPLIKRRLTAEERDQLCTGNVYVWEEAEHKGGLERWTDGRRWSQSRMKGDYLFYEEKVETTQEEKEAKAARRAHRVSGPLAGTFTPTRRQDRPAKPDGLTKQTYSTYVYIPGAPSPRKWHIVAYFSGNDYTRLPVIESYDYLRGIRVPDGIFLSGKGVVKRGDRYTPINDAQDNDSPIQPVASSRAYEQQQPLQPSGYTGGLERRPWSASSNPSPVTPYYPSPNVSHSPTAPFHYPHPQRTTSHDSASLPRLSTITPLQSPSSTVQPGTFTGNLQPSHRPGPSNYIPLSTEDRRALNTFRVVL